MIIRVERSIYLTGLGRRRSEDFSGSRVDEAEVPAELADSCKAEEKGLRFYINGSNTVII